MGAAPLSDPAPVPLTLPLPILACHGDKLPHVTVGHTLLPRLHCAGLFKASLAQFPVRGLKV